MTFLRRDPGNISNHFDELFNGIGHRGSSFMDINGIVHDGANDRFLMMEFKRRDEVLSEGQRITLIAFSQIKNCDAWMIRLLDDDDYSVMFYPLEFEDRYCAKVVQDLFRQWWNNNGKAQ